MNTIITLCSALLSGILATVVTLVVTHLQQKKSQKHEYKLQIFKDVVAYLTDITDNGVSTGNFQKAINQVFIAYNGCTDVINKFEIFRKSALDTHRDNNIVIGNLLQLIKAMADELSIDYSFSNDDLFVHPIQVNRQCTNK